jgi:hypothetical protein
MHVFGLMQGDLREYSSMYVMCHQHYLVGVKSSSPALRNLMEFDVCAPVLLHGISGAYHKLH